MTTPTCCDQPMRQDDFAGTWFCGVAYDELDAEGQLDGVGDLRYDRELVDDYYLDLFDHMRESMRGGLR